MFYAALLFTICVHANVSRYSYKFAGLFFAEYMAHMIYVFCVSILRIYIDYMGVYIICIHIYMCVCPHFMAVVLS